MMLAGRVLRFYSTRPLKKPTANVPDVDTFLTKIGRNMIQHKDHFASWRALMNASSLELKRGGIDTRDRRYLLGWLDRFTRHNMEPTEYPRGTKSWGGERNRRANRAAFYGRKRAEERESAQNGQ